MQRLEKNEQLVGKVLRRGQVNLVIEEAYFQDIPKSEREEYEAYFRKIWMSPLLHNQRSTNIIQTFWKEILRRSYLAGKSGAYEKLVHKYGEHPRQKFSMHYPKEKPTKPATIVIYIHGGYFINGTEEAFEYLGKAYVQKGYIMVTMGFRQLPQFRWPDPYDDCHTGFKQVVRLASQYGGDPNSIVYLTWSGGGLVALVNFFRFPDEYAKHVKLLVSMGSPWQISPAQKKVSSVFSDAADVDLPFPYHYLGGTMNIPINLVVGTKDRDFPQIYDHNHKYYKVYKDNGLNVTLNQVENHDHYDLILNCDLSLTKIREFQISQIDPNNELSTLLFMGDPKQRDQYFNILKNPIWIPHFGDSMDLAKERTIQQFRIINDLIERNDHTENYRKMFNIYESFSNGSEEACTKTMTHSSSVATVTFLGTEKHQYLLDEVAQGKIVFAFALTEAGGGNNLSEGGTRATYDEKTKQLVFNNATQFSKKAWCANLAVHGNYALVFASLIVKKKNEGVHAFAVKIRDQDHKALDGIVLEDLGHKIGLNGIDNGTLMFNNHRVSKDALLNKYGDIDDEGNYSSPFKSKNQRFFQAIERLLPGRLAIASIVCTSLKNIMLNGVTFSRYRYGVGETGQTQSPIWNFQLQQNQIMSCISRGLLLLFFHHYSKQMFLTDHSNVELSNICNMDMILMTEHTLNACITIRERCGATGILSSSHFGRYATMAQAAITGEGDNKVLVIKIAKDNLKSIGTRKLALPISKVTKITSIEQLRDTSVLLGLLEKRQAAMFRNLTERIDQLKKQRKEPYQITLKYVWEEMRAYVYAYAQRTVVQSSLKVLSHLKDPEHLRQLNTHFAISTLEKIIDNLGFYAYAELIPVSVAQKMVTFRSGLIREMANTVELMIHKLNIPEHALHCPLSKPDFFKSLQNLQVNSYRPSRL